MKYKIIRVQLTTYGARSRFDGFLLEDVCGTVDPFVGGDLIVDHLQAFENDNGSIEDIDGFLDAELEWAKEQVGKYMECEGLHFSAFATDGKVAFKEA